MASEGSSTPPPGGGGNRGPVQIDRLLDTVVKLGCSDLHLTVGRKPTIRHHGTLKNLETKVLDSDDMVSLMKAITPERNQQELQEVGGTDFGFAYGDAARFRVSIFRQKGDLAIVCRQIPNRLLTFEQICLPEICRELIRRPRGLFLVNTGTCRSRPEMGPEFSLGRESQRHESPPQNPQTRQFCTPTAMDPRFLEQVVRCAHLPQAIGSQIETPLRAFFYSLAGHVLPYASTGQFTVENASGDLYLEKLAQPQTATQPRPPEERAKIFRLDD